MKLRNYADYVALKKTKFIDMTKDSSNQINSLNKVVQMSAPPPPPQSDFITKERKRVALTDAQYGQMMKK